MKTNIIFFGSSKFAAYILERLIGFGQYQIKAVVTRPDQELGRKKILTETIVAKLAKTNDIQVLKPKKLDEEFKRELLAILDIQGEQILDDSDLVRDNIDLFIVAAYGKIIPKELLDIPKHGSINLHGSILPKYRGASPIQTAILNGDSTTGVTVMMMDEKMDHGGILASQKIDISQTETFTSLEQKMAETAADLLLETLPEYLLGQIKPVSQDENQATYCKLITKQDGYFDIDLPPSAKKLDQMIRAYYPWPTVWTRWNDKIVKFYPGGMIQMEGKKIISQKDFLRGYPDFPKLDMFAS